MDSTYNSCKYDLPLFFICVCTNFGYHCVATFIIEAETKRKIVEPLKILLERNKDWLPTSFMCDMDQREISAIAETFTSM